MGVVVPFPGHHWYRCPPGQDKCGEGHCMACVLSLCSTCHGAEASLTTHCPQTPMTHDQQDAVAAGHLDYTTTRGWHLVGGGLMEDGA